MYMCHYSDKYTLRMSRNKQGRYANHATHRSARKRGTTLAVPHVPACFGMCLFARCKQVVAT